MNERLGKARERGTSILAALVLMAMLGIGAVIPDVTALDTQSQLAAEVVPLPRSNPSKKFIEDNIPPVQVKCASGETVTINYACFQNAKVADYKKLQQNCRPGFSFKVIESKGVITVVPKPLLSRPDCKAPPVQCKSGKEALQSALPGRQCTVEYCVGSDENCKMAGTPVGEGEDLKLGDARDQGFRDASKNADTPERAQTLANQLGLPKADLDQLSKDLASEALKVEDARGEKAIQVTEAKTYLDQLAKGCQDDDCNPSTLEAAKKFAVEDLAKKQAELKVLEEQQAKLRNAQVALKGVKPCEGTNCATGQPAPAPIPVPVPRPRPDVQPPSGCSGIDCLLRGGNTRNDTFGGGSGLGGMLSKLFGGGGGLGGQPPAGNMQPQAPGSCMGGQTICSGNTLYSRNNQCVDTPVQYCQYGCSGNTCAQSPTQGQNCPVAPAQPNPSNCSNGSWRPTYSGACVSGWQCVPSGSDAAGPSAQISCQPQIADVGMTLAISYSCSSGTSVGSGFQTNGAQSGSATTTISNPPGNTNIATYGLMCTDQGRTGSAQCSVQIGRPSIVLVANPKAVASGKTSALGWVTSGMQSCVISSPDLSGFTSQNAGNTSVNGAVATPVLTSAATFLLHCVTLGGGTRQASTTVSVQ